MSPATEPEALTPKESVVSHPHLPPPFNTSTDPFVLIAQGAEALLYRTTFLSSDTSAALKVRPTKTWRHATLDKRLTRHRILSEARVLVKCKKDGVAVPAVLGLSWEEGWLVTEWVEGRTVKDVLRNRVLSDGEEGLKALLRQMGEAVAKLHAIGVVHGDLTTSNMMLRPREHAMSDSNGLEGQIILIDFGLATQAVQEEDRAVDLYVLERAFGSTHPREERLFDVVLQAYGGGYKDARKVLKKLEDVRMRGRKRSMLG